MHAQDCFQDFSYHRVYEVAPPEGIAYVEAGTHHLLLETSSLVDAGKLRTDGNDLRVTDEDCNPLPFFIQGFTERDTNAIYVGLPALDESGMEIHFYYGNPDETESLSDGNAVFLFFDDFEDGILDPTRWETVGTHAIYEEVDGAMHFSGDNNTGGIFQYITPAQGTSGPLTFDFVANCNNSRIYGIADTTDIQRIAFRYGTGAESVDSLNIIALMSDTLNGGTNPGLVYPDIIVPRVDMNIMSISAEVGPENELMVTRFMNLSNLDSNLDTLVNDNFAFDAVRPFFSAFGVFIKLEFMGARTTPAILLDVTRGDEEFIGVSNIWEAGERIWVNAFPNPGDGMVRLECSMTSPQRVFVFDSKGSVIRDLAYKAELDLRELAPGSYVLHISDLRGFRAVTTYVKE